MGLITSRLDLDELRPRRRRSQQEDTIYSYSLNKNYFSNYFLMGGERFEVNDPDYLFGDNCDLNFLTCSKPYSLPYKKAQQNLLVHLNNKQKAINKVSSRVNSLSSPLNILTGRHRQVSQSRKQDAQTQTLNKGPSSGPEPSQPLVMLINIRKETLRLVKCTNVHNIDSDQNSLMTNTASMSNATPVRKPDKAIISANNPGARGSHHQADDDMNEDMAIDHGAYYSGDCKNSDSSSLTSTTSSSATSKSGYTSVKDVPPSDCASEDNDECYQDALNEPIEDGYNDDDSPQARENRDVRITIERADGHKLSKNSDTNLTPSHCDKVEETVQQGRTSTTETSSKTLDASKQKSTPDDRTAARKLAGQQTSHLQVCNRVYNIEFSFDTEVDCSIRIFYFCTREVTSNNVSYKPQHATYKSKTYTYKRGLNQKFEQQEHTFQPYLFDEDLLIYKPLDLDGNYNPGAVFPIVIHLAALEGTTPRQSQSLVATVEKSQLDDSYSIKALKQLIFVDGVQYILQDIYGIENHSLASQQSVTRSSSRAPKLNRNFRSSCASLYSTSNLGSNLNLSDTASIASVIDGALDDAQNVDASMTTNQFKSLGSESTFECVICMSEERDTMLLPCRHLCLCGPCAQSLRYQANSCPICRCPFKAALNLRLIKRNQQRRSWSTNASSEALANDTSVKRHTNSEQYQASTTTIVRRESITSSATPLLSQTKSADATTMDNLSSRKVRATNDSRAKVFRSKPRNASAKSLPHQSSARDSTDSGESAESPVDQALCARKNSARIRSVTTDTSDRVTLEMQTLSSEGGQSRETGMGENARGSSPAAPVE